MPHTSLAARKRSKNPRVRNALLDTSPFSRGRPTDARKAPKRAVVSPFSGVFQTQGGAAPTSDVGPATTTPPGQDFTAGANIFLQQAAGLIPTDPGGVPPAILAALQLQQGAGLLGAGGFEGARLKQEELLTGGGVSPVGGPTSAFGIGGPFLQSTGNPFTAARFMGQQGGNGIPTVDAEFMKGVHAQAAGDAVPANIMRMGSMLGNMPGARADFARFLGMGQQTAEDFPEKISPALAAEARLMASNVQNNPFISPEGLSMLQRGLAPDPNMVQAAFWRHADPVTKQTMLGIFQGRGLLREQVGAAAEATRPA